MIPTHDNGRALKGAVTDALVALDRARSLVYPLPGVGSLDGGLYRGLTGNRNDLESLVRSWGVYPYIQQVCTAGQDYATDFSC